MSHPDPTQQDRPNIGVQLTGMIQADSNEIATLKARVERLTKVLDGMCGLILQDEHLRRDEATDTPFFVIAVPSRGGMEIQKGVWFSRGTADKFLESQRHNYGRKAYVYCPSGGMSDLQKLYAMAKEFKARGEV